MFLKPYQRDVVEALQRFFSIAREERVDANELRDALPPEKRHKLKPQDWVSTTFLKVGRNSPDKPVNGLGEYYPRAVLKIPTGGGKTLLAVEAIREYQNLFARQHTGLVVWIVPTETIYSQTVSKLRDKSNHLRQLLDQCSGGRTLILEKGQRLTAQDVDENLVILFVMIQSISRQNGKEALKVFQDSGGYEGFFPADNRLDLHAELLKRIPNLDHFGGQDDLLTTQIKTSLGNAVRASSPLIIIDEIHKVFSDTARATIDGLNPEMVLGLSATPKKGEMNELVTITGLQLKDAEMVKLDMHIRPPKSKRQDDWPAMLKEIQGFRDSLEKKALEHQRKSGLYIRPMALIQVEATGKDQRGKGRVHSHDVKEALIQLGVNPDEVAIKTSSQNDIEDVDLLSRDCPVRFLITKEALREGWDCPFAYILGIIPNVDSDTGLTQLVGRILRQPNARKTKVQELDESYVYYSKGQTRNILSRVSEGFQREGLEDLTKSLKLSDNKGFNETKAVHIRPEFLKPDLRGGLYLPVWLMTGKGGEKRRFSYARDIKPCLVLENFLPTAEEISKLRGSLGNQAKARRAFTMTLGLDSRTQHREEDGGTMDEGAISLEYATRRYAELIENPFAARHCAAAHIDLLKRELGEEKLSGHFSFLISELCHLLEIEKSEQEENNFLELLRTGSLVLAVSDEPDLGYRIPDTDSITVSRLPSHWKSYLYDDVEISTMNSLESKVGDLLDNQAKILWWFRNRVGQESYAFQGWRDGKIHPDFVAAKKTDSGKLELVYVVESKGEHLLGNADTRYKKSVMDRMNEQHESGKVKKIQQTDLFAVNDEVEFHLVEQGSEEADLNRLLK
jgi:type III restriction enzyme